MSLHFVTKVFRQFLQFNVCGHLLQVKFGVKLAHFLSQRIDPLIKLQILHLSDPLV